MKRSDINPQCQAAKPYYYDYLCERQEHIPDANSVHIAGCPDCQNEVQWLKQTDSEAEAFSIQKLQAISHAAQMQLHCTLVNQPVRCSAVKSFLPILAIPEMAVRISTPVTEHINACAECTRDLKTLKQLDLSPEQLSCLSRIFIQIQNQTGRPEDRENVTALLFQCTEKLAEKISPVINRPDSGIVTYFRPKKDTSSSSEKPFTVEVKNDLTDRQQPRQARIAAKQPRWFFRPIAAAAAVLLVAILLFQNTSVKATDIGQIYQALKNVQNVIMTQYELDNPNPIQTTYIDRSLGIKLFKTIGGFVLYDVHNKTQKTRTGPASDIQQTNLDRTVIQSVAKTMDVPWGLLPFKQTSELPDGAVWEKVPSEKSGLNTEQTEIYDLFWTEISTSGKTIEYRWRCLLDPGTKYPFKVEWWKKAHTDQDDYELLTFTEIAYPSEDQFLQIINQAGF